VRRKLVKNISESKLKDNSNMNNILLKEMLELKLNVKSRRKLDLLLKLKLLPIKLKEKDWLKSIDLRWKRRLKLGDLSKKKLEWNMNKELSLSA